MSAKRTYLLSVGAAALTLIASAAGQAQSAASAGRAVNATPVAAPAAPAALPSFANIVDKVAPAVVSINVEATVTPTAYGAPFGDSQSLPPQLRRMFPQLGDDGPSLMRRGSGSGFFISADGYIVTNNHVIDTAQKITVRTADQRRFTAKVVGRDEATDLAVLKIDANNMPFVSFEDSAKPRVGDWVVAVGNPFGLGGTATAGIVSALNRQNIGGSSGYVDYLQIDAPINPGNSGGPTFDLNGRVVGINSAIYSSTGGSVGIGFDIPADVAAQVTRQLIANGKVVRGYIGATVQDVTQEIAESLGVEAKGALVGGVEAGGPAARAGLQSGDIVLKVDGADVSGANDLTRRIGLAQSGANLRLDVRRDGRPVALTVRTGERPGEQQVARAATRPASRGALGLSLGPDPAGEGVRVEAVAPGSPADDKGLEAGDVIVRVGGQAARSPQDVAAAVSAARSEGRRSVLLLVARDGRQSFVPLELGQG